jgi:hypothetical protein
VVIRVGIYSTKIVGKPVGRS